MISVQPIIDWMLAKLGRDGCLYQDDVVDYLVKTKQASLLRENADGNLVIGKVLLGAFRKATENDIVWVKTGFYWRFRVPEDEASREARG